MATIVLGIIHGMQYAHSENNLVRYNRIKS